MRHACAEYIRWRSWEHFFLTKAQSKALETLHAEAPTNMVEETLLCSAAVYKAMLAKTLNLFPTERADDMAW